MISLIKNLSCLQIIISGKKCEDDAKGLVTSVRDALNEDPKKAEIVQSDDEETKQDKVS